MQTDHIRTLKILWSMLEFSGPRKHQNNPRCTEIVKVLKMWKPDTLRNKKNLFCIEVQIDTNWVHEAWLQPATCTLRHNDRGLLRAVVVTQALKS